MANEINNNLNSNNTQQENENPSLDIKKLVFMFLDKWYLFVISAFVALVIGFIINRYTTKIYQTTGTVLVKDNKQGLDPTKIMTNIAYGTQQNLDNEMAILKSYSLTERVVKKMGIEVTYMVKGRLTTAEFYDNETPFIVEFDHTVPQAVSLVYNIAFANNGKFTLTVKEKDKRFSRYDYILNEFTADTVMNIDFTNEYKLGEWFETGFNRLRIIPNDKCSAKTAKSMSSLKLSFWLNSYPSLIRQMKQFTVAAYSKQASIINVTMTGANRKKIVDFTNTLMHEYVARNLENKDAVSDKTIMFIDQELENIREVLEEAESELKEFRTKNDIMDLDAQASQVYTKLQALDRERAEIAINLKIYKRLQDYIEVQIDDPVNLAAPSTMGITDQLLNRLVSELVTLSQTKASQLLTQTEQHPQIIKLDEQIATTKKTLLETVNNLVLNTQLSLNEVDKRIAQTESQTKILPEKQRQLLTYERNFSLNDETYKFLMQRRAEAQIIKASNTPDAEILDEARMELINQPIRPKSKMNYLIALIIGLLIPAIYLYLKDFFNMTINDKNDIEKLTDFPVIGQVAQVDDKDPLIVINKPKAPIAEAFRSIRTNIEFISQGKLKCTILVTGDTQGIGKTFNSINIASIYGLYAKKTVLLGFDMRKPKLFQEFHLTNNVGLSSFLSNKEPLENVIQPSGKIPSLDIITSGPIPPNPAELIASDKCVELFTRLKEMYDYIIIDTPPLGLVTDAYLLTRFSDVNLFIVRQNYTNRNIFGGIIKDIKNRGISGAIILNGIEMAKGYGYRYGNYRYSYKYGYNSGYTYGGYGKYGSYGYGKYGGYGSYYGEDEDKSGDKKEHHHHHHHSDSKK